MLLAVEKKGTYANLALQKYASDRPWGARMRLS